MSNDTCTISVSFGNDEKTATIRFSHRSKPIIALLLGIDNDAKGKPLRLYFNSLFHEENKNLIYIGWQPSGCISTILERAK